MFPMWANIDKVREKREKIIITTIKNVEDCDKYLVEFSSSKNAPIVIDKRDRYIVDNIKSIEDCDSFIRFNRESLYISQVKEKREKIMEHRLVMAQHLNRMLTRTEVIHHLDHNPSNNNIELL